MSKPKHERALADHEAQAILSNVRTSPRKLNLVAAMIRNLPAQRAIATLTFSKRRIAHQVRKTLESAIANAENNHQLDVDRLVVTRAEVGRSIVMRRFHARGRGRSARIEKWFSHMKIVVAEKQDEVEADNDVIEASAIPTPAAPSDHASTDATLSVPSTEGTEAEAARAVDVRRCRGPCRGGRAFAGRRTGRGAGRDDRSRAHRRHAVGAGDRGYRGGSRAAIDVRTMPPRQPTNTIRRRINPDREPRRMGHKVNPVGLRLGINRTWDSRWYAGGDYAKLLHDDLKLRDHLRTHLRGAGVSRVVIERPAKKPRVTIYAARPGVVIGKKGQDIEVLKKELGKMANAEVSLNIVEIRKPEIDATLIAENIAQQLERRVAFRRAMKRAVQSAMRLGALGIRINCGGRLGGAEIARVEWYREGRVPLHTLRGDVDYGTATAKTTYGTCGVKVWVFKGEIMQHDPMAQDRRAAEQAPQR